MNEINVNTILETIDWQIQLKSEDICDSNSTFVLAMVLSAVQNSYERDVIRQTWANPELHNYTRVR